MFDKDIRISGIYATHLKALARSPQNSSKPYLFDRYIDVYMNAAVVGLLTGNPITDPDFSVKDTATILADVVIREQYTCSYLYRLVMLLDKTSNLTPEQRIDRAFRDDGDDKHPEKMVRNIKLFNAYVLAGIEDMYDKIADKAVNEDEMCLNAYNMMEDAFKDPGENISPRDYLHKR